VPPKVCSMLADTLRPVKCLHMQGWAVVLSFVTSAYHNHFSFGLRLLITTRAYGMQKYHIRIS
jgi:hypothetical protein